MTITALQRAERSNYIGASDAPLVVLGQLYGKTRYNLWQEKTGRIEADVSGNLNTRLGDALEPLLGEIAQEHLGAKLYRCHQTIYHPDFDFIAANLDFRIGRKLPMVPVECKFTSDRTALVEPKLDNVIQLTDQMACTGAPVGHLIYIVAGFSLEVRVYTIERDEAAVDGLIEQLSNFWYGHVLADVPPPFETNDDVSDWYGRSRAVLIEATDEIAEKVKRLGAVRKAAKGLETEEEALAFAIKCFMGSADTLTYEGKPICTWKSNKDSVKFDEDTALLDLSQVHGADPGERKLLLADIRRRYTFIQRGARPLKVK